MHGDGGLEFDRSVLSTLLEASFVSADIDERPIGREVVSGYLENGRSPGNAVWSLTD